MERIKNIFEKNTLLYKEIEWVCYYFRVQNQDAALRKSAMVLSTFGELIPVYIETATFFNEEKILVTENGLLEMCSLLMEAQKQKDYILLADYYELMVLSFVQSLQEKIIAFLGGEPEGFDKSAYEGYQLEYAGNGALTLRVEREGKGKYYHSNKSPFLEGLMLANSWYSYDYTKYVIYGLGLGYHIDALALWDENIDIEVYESDKNIYEICQRYGVLEELQKRPNVTVHYDSSFLELSARLENFQEDEVLVIHEPSLATLPTSSVKERMENYFVQYSSGQNQLKLLNGNFRINTKKVSENVDVLKDKIRGKNVYLVAAGPSLDKNYHQLKNVSANDVIISTGTAFRKLIKAGIRPDYVIEIDANRRITNHFRDVNAETVPMIMLSTATHWLNRDYQGEKYLVLQKDYSNAEKYAAERGFTLYETGGSVMTTALDIAIRMESKKIVVLGLDLAYTDNYAHADGTSRRNIPEGVTDLRRIKAIDGSDVMTNKSLDMYRQWIENRIAREKNSGIQFIDATEGGAFINGMRIYNLEEILREERG